MRNGSTLLPPLLRKPTSAEGRFHDRISETRLASVGRPSCKNQDPPSSVFLSSQLPGRQPCSRRVGRLVVQRHDSLVIVVIIILIVLVMIIAWLYDNGGAQVSVHNERVDVDNAMMAFASWNDKCKVLCSLHRKRLGRVFSWFLLLFFNNPTPLGHEQQTLLLSTSTILILFFVFSWLRVPRREPIKPRAVRAPPTSFNSAYVLTLQSLS